ncbi:MAG: GMC family oxidoreductase N-terminal domain-containing protein [Rhizobiales bacterium]|nr:GMC family oxidoreductase N-terminal domain-containing protein [Hyphomicrobiales bacterium]
MAYDYIIVGSGPAGCVLANRLSEDPTVQVLLLEAGGRDSHPYFAMPAGFAKMTKGIASWGWSTVPQKHLNGRVLWYTQGKVLGGGSTINAQVFTRGNPMDYDDWAATGCAGWSFREILPYFKRSEDNQRYVNAYHGYGGPIGVSAPVNPLPIGEAFIRAAQEYGLPYNPDFNGARQEGVGHYQVTVKDARRSSGPRGYLHPIRDRRNLTIRTNAFVTRVVVEKGRAIGVEVSEKGGAAALVRAEREVLVTSGGMGSPRLLLLSGIGPADHLKSVGVPVVHDLKGVGGNLQDHIDLYCMAECTDRHTYDHVARPHHTLWAGLQYLLFRKGPVASTLFETGGFFYVDKSARSPDVQMHFGLGSGIEAGVPSLRNGGLTLNSCFVRPRSRGTVRLASADPAVAPLLDPNYWADPYDRRISLGGLATTREILRQPALKPFILAERLPGPDVTDEAAIREYVYRTCKVDHHPVGACKMGVDDEAVVAPDLKVRGLEGLRVCDSSIMPLIPSSNTNAPTFMVGEKASDLIRGRTPLPKVDLPAA